MGCLIASRPAGDGRGFTLIELLIVVGLIATIAAVSFPGLVRARVSALESAAMGSMRAVNSAQSTYSASCGRGGYAQTLADLQKPAAGSGLLFISPDVPANGVIKSGYIMNLSADTGAAIVALSANTCNLATLDAVSLYFVESHPAATGLSGQRSFASDTRAALYWNGAGTTIAPGMAGAKPLQ